jgi:hypothetical protein
MAFCPVVALSMLERLVARCVHCEENVALLPLLLLLLLLLLLCCFFHSCCDVGESVGKMCAL